MNKQIAVLASLTLAMTVGAVMQHAGDTGDSALTADTSEADAAATRPMNHGFFVSKAAHTCEHGSHAVHGKCVRVVAQSSMGKRAEGRH
jgi:hypothetical protein